MTHRAPSFETKSDYAYRIVRDRILSADLEPGTVLQQRDLAARLGISTTPLREALRRLMSEGLVELDSHRDARISPLRAEEARDLVEIRRSLDPLAAGLAAERRTMDDLAQMRSTLKDLDAFEGPLTSTRLAKHRAFHAAVYRASHNEILIETLDALWDKADRYRGLALAEGMRPAPGDVKADEHRLLVDHIVAREAEAAADLMRHHIDCSLTHAGARPQAS